MIAFVTGFWIFFVVHIALVIVLILGCAIIDVLSFTLYAHWHSHQYPHLNFHRHALSHFLLNTWLTFGHSSLVCCVLRRELFHPKKPKMALQCHSGENAIEKFVAKDIDVVVLSLICIYVSHSRSLLLWFPFWVSARPAPLGLPLQICAQISYNRAAFFPRTLFDLWK